MSSDVLVERTYQALMGVVQTTAVSRKVLARPPFTFLHKLLLETLSEFDLFSEQQMDFSTLITKQAKVPTTCQQSKCVSVSDTLEFLLQLCEVCRIPNRDIKDAAAQQVREKGDAHLYSSGVIFRKGLVLIQGVIRSFLRRRVRKAAPRLNGAPVHEQELSMTEGTRFLKELADGRIYNGIIRSVQKSIFVLGYEEDAEAQDKVNEIEMKIILEESQRLSAAREDRLTRSGSNERADGDISLADLPDLTESAYPHAPGFIKRVSSRDSASLLGPKASKSNSLKRAQSQRPSITETELFGLPSSNSLLSRDAPLGPEGQDTQTNQFADTADGASAHIPSFPKLGIPGTKPLRPLLKRGSSGSIASAHNKAPQKDPMHSSPMAQPNNSSAAPATRASPLQLGASQLSIQRSGAPANAASVPPPSASAEGVVDTAFAGTYQTTDQRTQEKQALIRDIVMRIDSYMKRKRLRVIDLFRFCDADGNGSISPDEMIDTLSQMEIQLAPDQAREFLLHIDKDGNGSIDVDEFEELVRVARRNEAQREQLKKELNGPRKQAESKSSQKQSAVMKAKAKQSILDEFRAAQEEGGDGMSANQLRSLIGRLALPGLNDPFVSSIIDRAVEIAASASAPLSPPSGSSLVSYHHLAKALDELEWTNKSNRFLDQSWIRQFDSQLERAIREYEML
uniref:EF-hand domain-containing protein n=1 Tax=Phytophthora ramorum TaxID=164328 RepID=H3GT05_PHYRM